MDIKYRVLMFPWLASGHITPLLELAQKLIKRNFHVYICSTPINIDSFKPSLSEEYSQLINFVELHLPSLPPHNHTTKNLPPHLMNTLIKALDIAKDDFYRILESLKPDLVIYDYLQPWVPELASSLSIPAVNFMSSSAAMTSFAYCLFKKPGEAFPFPDIYPRGQVSTRNHQQPETSLDMRLRPFQSIERSCDILLINSFSDIEAKYIDFLSGIVSKKVIPVGPLVQNLPSNDDSNAEIIKWLEKKEQASVLFVSFGSECYLTKEEIDEIAKGLELSKVNFIWVIRFPMGQKVSLAEALPEGFSNRVGEKGLILEDWAPQMRILGHANTGGFLSHCGWNSVLESMSFGVPIVGMAMHLDQPVNARLIDTNGFGMEVKRDEYGKYGGEELARVIREVMLENSGEAIRKKARELKDSITKKLEEEKEIDDAVEKITQLLRVKK